MAPWWFSGVIGLAGILLGIGTKWLIDTIALRSARAREDRLRFTADKRAAYAEFLAATYSLADAEHDGRQLTLDKRYLDNTPDADKSLVDDYDDRLARYLTQREDSYGKVNETMAIVDLIAPMKVVESAGLLLSRAAHPHLLQTRLHAEAAFVRAARADLGLKVEADAKAHRYEPYIGADDPRSGVTAPTMKAAEEEGLASPSTLAGTATRTAKGPDDGLPRPT